MMARWFKVILRREYKAVRKDISLAMSNVSGASLVLTDEQFQELECVGRCRLTPAQKKNLCYVLDSYFLYCGIEENASTPQEQHEYLEKAQESVTFLYMFLSEMKKHAIYKPRMRVEVELVRLFKTEDYQGEDGEVRDAFMWDGLDRILFPELEKRIAEAKHHKNSVIIDFERMERDFVFWKAAIDQALNKLSFKKVEDKGGQEEDWLVNKLLYDLSTIYDRAKGKKKALERFCQNAVDLIPKDKRPILPTQAGSIKRRIDRLSRLDKTLNKKRKPRSPKT